jgi:DNA-binding MarR family transcriptional regulator
VTDERVTFDRLLTIFDQVMTKMGSMHSPTRDFNTGVPLYRAEIHTIKTIGENPGINVTRLAERMTVTKGAVSQTIAKLVRKKLVQKTHVRENAKEIRLELTDLGWIGFHRHEQFHQEMFEAVREYFGDQLEVKLDMFVTVMTDLDGILSRFGHKEGGS